MNTTANRPAILERAVVEEFLFREAECLDEWRVMDWIALLTADIDYRIPVRTTRETRDAAHAFSADTFHMVEDRASLTARMQRIASGLAFSESPRSRVRRHISNVRVVGAAGNEVQVRSNLLFFWSRDELQRLLSGERHDVLRTHEGSLRLARRNVLLDHTALPIPNLSMVL